MNEQAEHKHEDHAPYHASAKDVTLAPGDADRDRAMILLSTKAGLRACEIAGLDWSTVLDAQGRVSGAINVRDAIAKKRGGRRIPTHPDPRLALERLARTTNPFERLDGEIRRGAEVVGVFPNEAAITRLVDAIRFEQNDEWAERRARHVTLETIAVLSHNSIVALPGRQRDQPCPRQPSRRSRRSDATARDTIGNAGVGRAVPPEKTRRKRKLTTTAKGLKGAP